MTPLERLQAAREIGREACKQGKACLPAIDKNLEDLHVQMITEEADALASPWLAQLRDAWRFGWYEEYYSR